VANSKQQNNIILTDITNNINVSAMKKEVKIAIVAIVGIMLLFFGMTFLKGLDLFSSNKLYKIRFSDISGLSTSTPIYADGYKVGVIKDIHYDFSKQGEILADVGINEAMPIPQGTRAEIASDLLGNVQVKLIRPALSAATLAEGGIIDGTISDNALGSVKSMVPDIQKMLPKLDSILYNVNRLLQDPALAASLHNVSTITSGLTTSTRQLNVLLAQLNGEMPVLTQKVNTVLDNTNGTMVSAKGAVANADKMLANLNSQVEKTDIAATMQKLDKTMANLQTLTDKLNSRDGSLGLLMNDRALYDNLTRTMRDADSLMVDLRKHPKRYVHFSVFGRKDK